LFPQLIYSQVVNIEKERKQIKPGFQGQIYFGGNFTQNTKQILQVDFGGDVQYTWKSNTVIWLNDVSLLKYFSSNTQTDLINKNFEHIRYNYTFRDSSFLTYEAFFQRQQNRLRYINMRLLYGTGFRFRIIKTKTFRFFVAPLVMHEYEQMSDSLHTVERMLRGDFYISAWFKLAKNLSLVHVTYYQPAIIDLGSSRQFKPWRDYRIASETDLCFSLISNKLSLSWVLDLNYDSYRPAELNNYPLFYSFSSKISYKF
jgi:hypothetical protein